MLRVTVAPDARALVRRLGDVLAAPPTDVFARELVVVHSRGNERWISQQLAQRLGAASHTPGAGVCAGVEFPSPASVVATAVAATAGGPLEDPWAADALAFQLLTLLDDGAADEAWAQPLVARCGRGMSPKRASGASTVAALLARYARHRPQMLLRWLDGEDVDGALDPLAAHHRWQPELYRHLRARIATASPPERAAAAIAALRDGARVPALPSRLALFGFTALPMAELAVLTALATSHQVELLLLHPSTALWARTDTPPAPVVGGWPQLPSRVPADADPAATADRAVLPQHPLLASWGRDARELQAVVGALAPDAATTVLEAAEQTPTTLLARLQRDLRDDVDPRGRPAMAVAATDRSVQVHAAPGPARQVQVLRDAILALLAADPTLEPRDIVVMCPDVESFAPHVEAVLGRPVATATGETTALRVRLADRSLRQVNPLFALLATLLELCAGRVTASALLDLVGLAAVRRRFGFDEQDLDRLARWVRDSGMRWGLDAAHRGALGLPEVHHTTIGHGLERLLLGVAQPLEEGEDLVVGDVTPYDHVEGGDVVLVGRLAELVDRLAALVRASGDPRDAAGWGALLLESVDQLGAAGPGEEWARTQVVQVLGDLAGAAAATAATTAATAATAAAPLGLADVRALLAQELAGRPRRENHRSGDLTVCTLVPMRSVPHRVVCLLGMDDQVFPRRTVTPVDDLIGAAPRVGDRDPRTEDRQLLLDAVLAAGEALLVVYDGADERSGAARPPCVPVAELLDVLRETATDADGHGFPPHLHTVHPQAPYDPAVFVPDAPPAFDAVAAAGARALLQVPVAPAPTPLPARDPEPVVDRDQLLRTLRDPAAQVLLRRLGAWAEGVAELPSDEVPTSLIGLAEWSVGEAFLRRRAHDDPALADALLARLHGEGQIPPLGMADAKLAKIRTYATRVVQFARGLVDLDGEPERLVDIDVAVGARRITGRLHGVRGTRRVLLTYSKLRAKQQLEVWLDLLLLTAADPTQPWSGAAIGRHVQKDPEDFSFPPRCIGFPRLGATPEERHKAATDRLAALLTLYDELLANPTVLPPDCALAGVEAVLDGRSADAVVMAIEEPWRGGGPVPGANRDAANILLLGGVRGVDELLAFHGGGTFLDRAQRLYGPLCEDRIRWEEDSAA